MSKKIKTIIANINEDEYFYPKYSSDINLDILGFFVNGNQYTNAEDRAILSFLTQSEEICSKVRFLKQPCQGASNNVVYDIKRAISTDRESAFFIDLPFEFDFEKKYEWYNCLPFACRNSLNYIKHIIDNYEEICIYLGNKYDIEEIIKKINIIRKELKNLKEEIK